MWRSCIQSVTTAFLVKTKRTSNFYVSSAPISVVMVSPFAWFFIMFKKLIFVHYFLYFFPLVSCNEFAALK